LHEVCTFAAICLASMCSAACPSPRQDHCGWRTGAGGAGGAGTHGPVSSGISIGGGGDSASSAGRAPRSGLRAPAGACVGGGGAGPCAGASRPPACARGGWPREPARSAPAEGVPGPSPDAGAGCELGAEPRLRAACAAVKRARRTRGTAALSTSMPDVQTRPSDRLSVSGTTQGSLAERATRARCPRKSYTAQAATGCSCCKACVRAAWLQARADIVHLGLVQGRAATGAMPEVLARAEGRGPVNHDIVLLLVQRGRARAPRGRQRRRRRRRRRRRAWRGQAARATACARGGRVRRGLHRAPCARPAPAHI